MKVAIIGGGVSGLACAHELERHGICPTIFERKSYIGDVETHVTATLQVIDRPIRDWISYVNKNFNISIKPVNTVNILTHHSPGKTVQIKGNFGYFLKRSKDEDSLLPQLFSQLKKTSIEFNENADYEKLYKNYDFVVIANGTPGFTDELGCWYERLSGWVRGAVVLGNFNPNELIMWINTHYCNKGYAYLTPFNEKKASVSVFVPYVNNREIEEYWEEFLYAENIRYEIIEEFQTYHYSGLVYPHSIGNIYFTGTAGGAISAFLGFGQVKSILQGVYAAQAITRGKDYEKLLKNITRKTWDMWEFRKNYNKAANREYDEIVTVLGLPGIEQIIYDSNIDLIKYGAGFLRLLEKFKK